MKFFIPTAFSALILVLVASSVQSQSIYTDMASGIAKQGIAEAERLLDEAPSILGIALEKAEQGEAYETSEYCRGALQAVVNVGAIVANITPFSKVWTFEDDRGPVGKFRIMLNGEQVHTEIYCSENLMMASALEWGTGNRTPEEVEMNSFSALAGAMLIMKLQGVFDEAADIAARSEEINRELSFQREPSNQDDRVGEEEAIREILDAAVAEAVELSTGTSSVTDSGTASAVVSSTASATISSSAVASTAPLPRVSRPPRRSENAERAYEVSADAVRVAEVAAIRAILDAKSAAAAAESAELPTVTLTGGQRQGVIEAVSRNWNKSIVIGKENYEQLVIVLEVSVAPNGMIVSGSVKPVEPAKPVGDFEVAYEAARRAVLRAEVIPLPAGVYPAGVKLMFTFDPALNAASLN